MVTDTCQLRVAHPDDFHTGQVIGAGCWFIQATQQVHEGGFAGTGRAHHCYKLTWLYSQVDFSQGNYRV
jgi:hypothetical protein